MKGRTDPDGQAVQCPPPWSRRCGGAWTASASLLDLRGGPAARTPELTAREHRLWVVQAGYTATFPGGQQAPVDTHSTQDPFPPLWGASCSSSFDLFTGGLVKTFCSRAALRGSQKCSTARRVRPGPSHGHGRQSATQSSCSQGRLQLLLWVFTSMFLFYFTPIFLRDARYTYCLSSLPYV